MKRFLPRFSDFLQGLMHIVYPLQCQVCGCHIDGESESPYVCSFCLDELPLTKFEYVRGNAVEQLFWGKVMIHSAFSGYYFRRGERLRKLIHAFKYQGRRDVAVLLGRRLGQMMLQSGFHNDYDCLIPVPMHPSKIRKRGYNQAVEIANGISEVTGLPVREDILYRVVEGSTQTKKSKGLRWASIQDTYACESPESNAGIKPIVVDDVLTTGATIEVCCRALSAIPNATIGVTTLGVVQN